VSGDRNSACLHLVRFAIRFRNEAEQKSLILHHRHAINPAGIPWNMHKITQSCLNLLSRRTHFKWWLQRMAETPMPYSCMTRLSGFKGRVRIRVYRTPRLKLGSFQGTVPSSHSEDLERIKCLRSTSKYRHLAWRTWNQSALTDRQTKSKQCGEMRGERP